MFESKLIVSFNPQMLNKFEERKITQDIVEKAIEKGYVIDGRTPSFLFKYESIIDLLIRTHDNLEIFSKNLDILMSCETRRKELTLYYAEHFTKLGYKLDASYFVDYIEPDPKYADFIQLILGVEFLKKHPDYVYREEFDLDNYYASDEIFDFLDEINVDFNKLHRGVEYDIELYLKRFPRILKAVPFARNLMSYKVSLIISKMVEEGKLTFDDIPDYLIEEELMLKLIIKQPSLLDRFPEYIDIFINSYRDNPCIEEFINNLPDSLNDLESLSFAFNSIRGDQAKLVKEAIMQSGFLITKVAWEFILNDKELIMDQIRRNPNILNTCPGLFPYSIMEEEDYKEIMDVVEKSGITLYTIQSFYYRNDKFLEFLCKNNPNIFYNIGKNNTNSPLHYMKDKFIDRLDGPIVPSAPPYGEKFDNGIVDAIRMNPYNYYSLIGCYSQKEYALDAYEALLQSGIDLYERFGSRLVLPENIYDAIEDVRNIPEMPYSMCFDTYDRKAPDYPLYYVANYVDLVEIRNPYDTYVFKLSKDSSSFEIEVDDLKPDFSNYGALKFFLSEEELLRINDMYWANKKNIVIDPSLLSRNPYIYINELLINNNNFDRASINLNDVQIDYFNRRFKELNCKLNRNNYIFVRDFDLLFDALSNGFDLRYFDNSWMSNEELIKWNDLICEMIKSGKIKLDYIPVDFSIKHYHLMKEYFDSASLMRHLYYFVNDGEHEEIFLDLIENDMSFVHLSDFKYLDDNVIRRVFEKNLFLLSFAKRKYSDFDFRIQNILDEFEYEEVGIDVKGKLTKEVLDKIIRYNPTNLKLLMYYKSLNMISSEMYLEYYKKCLDNIKNGFVVTDIEFDPNIDLQIDKDFVESLMFYNRYFCVQYLKSYYDRERDYVFNYINDNYVKLRHVSSLIVEMFTLKDIDLLISKRADFLDELTFMKIYEKFNNIDNFEKIYNYWCLAGKPLPTLSILNNGYICKNVLSNEIYSSVGFDFATNELSNPYSINMVYNYYKSKDNIDITSFPLFYTNPLILLDYAGKEVSFPDSLKLDEKEKTKIYLMIAKENPAFVFKLNSFYRYSVERFINDDPVTVMNMLPFDNCFKNLIMSALFSINYQFDEKTPSIYLDNSKILLKLLEDNNDRIDFVISVYEENRMSGSDSLKDYISKVVVEKGLFKYAKYVSRIDLKDFLIECIDNDFNVINEFKNIDIDMNVMKYIFGVALEKINSGEYIIDENTPEFLFYNDEIRAIVRKNNPRLLDNFKLERLDRARDHSLIKEAIQQPGNVDELFKGVDRNYPVDLVNELVDKLISLGYEVSDKTPRFLLCNYKFIYHLLKNNVIVDDKYINNFVTFENYHILKDTEMFIELINKGYGYEFSNFILKFGLETTLQLAEQYGYLLNLVDISKIRLLEDIPGMLVSNNLFSDVFDRVDDFESFINRCNASKIPSYAYTQVLMRKYLKDVDANKDKIIILIKNDFSIYNNDGVSKYFFNNIELMDLFVTYTTHKGSIKYAVNSCSQEFMTEEVLMHAIENGYEIDENTPQYIRTNPFYVYQIIRNASYNDVCNMLHTHKDIALNQATINELVNMRYELTSFSPDVILRNLEFLVPYFQRCRDSKRYRNGMNVIDASMYKELLYSIDIKQMVLYFKDIVAEDKYEEFVLQFVGIAEEKRDVLIKMLTDGKKLNYGIKVSYEKYILEHINDIKYEDMDKVLDCLIKISQSNSGEIRQFANTLVGEVLKFENYEDIFNRIEEIFLQDYLPTVTKLFLVFKVLHKDYSVFDVKHLSPVLMRSTNAEKDDVIYKDLLRAAFRSNNRSLLEYLHDLSDACDILEQYCSDKESVDLDSLNKSLMFLLAIVKSTAVKNHDSSLIKLTNDYDDLISMLREHFKGYTNLKDAIVQNLLDVPTYSEAISYISEYALETDKRNRARVSKGFSIEPGDYIKGIGSINYLTNILQNGSVSKEFLGDSAGSDATPLDTDLSRIKVETSSIDEAITSTAARGYGDIYFILKDGNRFVVTRTKEGGECLDSVDSTRLESFYTGVCDDNNSDHYGIRTGFASSEIDYIVSTDKRVQLEVALNGFYIPIVDKNGNLIFTPSDYDRLRDKMSGIEYYCSGPYKMASYDDLLAPGVEDVVVGISENRISVKMKHNAIKAAVRKGMSEVNVIMKDKLDGNVMTGFADLIDTGSTARGTDLPGKADFDYICRVDRSLFNDPFKFEKFKEAIKNQFISIDKEEYVNGNFRFKGVKVEGLDEKVDIDLSFVIRTNKLTISSDESLLTRMEAIENGNYSVEGDGIIPDFKEARDLVAANILMAKKLLKTYKCYKKHSSPEKEGGLGGIGIENWILQNGGSLTKAIEDFMDVADKCTSFEEFKNQYIIWDFGQNHYALEGSDYSHDNFVYKNMDAAGYERMKAALQSYLKYGMDALNEEKAESIVNQVNDMMLGGSSRMM